MSERFEEAPGSVKNSWLIVKEARKLMENYVCCVVQVDVPSLCAVAQSSPPVGQLGSLATDAVRQFASRLLGTAVAAGIARQKLAVRFEEKK